VGPAPADKVPGASISRAEEQSRASEKGLTAPPRVH